MMTELRLTDAALAFGGTLLNPDCGFSQVSIDSRQISEGQLFVALEGERFDAHEFLEEVTTLACGLVVSKPNKNLSIPQWVVEVRAWPQPSQKFIEVLNPLELQSLIWTLPGQMLGCPSLPISNALLFLRNTIMLM